MVETPTLQNEQKSISKRIELKTKELVKVGKRWTETGKKWLMELRVKSGAKPREVLEDLVEAPEKANELINQGKPKPDLAENIDNKDVCKLVPEDKLPDNLQRKTRERKLAERVDQKEIAYPTSGEIFSDQSRRYVNTEVFGDSFPAEGWPDNNAVLAKDYCLTTDRGPLEVDKSRSVILRVPPDWGRAGIRPSDVIELVPLTDGREPVIFYDQIIKGMPMERAITDDQLQKAEGDLTGWLNTGDVVLDYERSIQLHEAGVRTSIGLIDFQHKKGDVYTRVARDGLRTTEPEALSLDDFDVIRTKVMKEEELTEIPTPEKYIAWFAKKMGQNAAKMEGARYIHNNLGKTKLVSSDEGAIRVKLELQSNVSYMAEVFDHGTGESFGKVEEGRLSADIQNLGEQYVYMLAQTYGTAIGLASRGFLELTPEIKTQIVTNFNDTYIAQTIQDGTIHPQVVQSSVSLLHDYKNNLQAPEEETLWITQAVEFMEKQPREGTVLPIVDWGKDVEFEQTNAEHIRRNNLHTTLIELTKSGQLPENKLEAFAEGYVVRKQVILDPKLARSIYEIAQKHGIRDGDTNFYGLLLNYQNKLAKSGSFPAVGFDRSIIELPQQEYALEMLKAVNDVSELIMESVYSEEEREKIKSDFEKKKIS